jgi:uncharacterized protein involved in exopolysaccharide biosynthesis
MTRHEEQSNGGIESLEKGNESQHHLMATAAGGIRGSTTPDRAAWGEISLLELLNTILYRWRLVVGLPAAAGLATVTVSFLIPPTFTASTAFAPEVTSQGLLPSGVAGLAGQFGIQLGTEASQSAQFYAVVLKSQDIMDRVLLSRYANPRSPSNPPDSTTLLSILEVEGDSLADSLHDGREAMEDLVSVSVDELTNVVTLTMDSHYPELAAAVANRFVEYLNEFNAKTRQFQAKERRQFVEHRLAAAERELQEVEQAMMEFYQRNRTWQQSPQLTFEQERLQRQVRIREEVSLTLRREYETARIAEVNDTPIITVIYAATPPQEKSKPKRILLGALSFLLGGIMGVFIALGSDYLQRDEKQYRLFRGQLAQIWRDIRPLSRRAQR